MTALSWQSPIDPIEGASLAVADRDTPAQSQLGVPALAP